MAVSNIVVILNAHDIGDRLCFCNLKSGHVMDGFEFLDAVAENIALASIPIVITSPSSCLNQLKNLKNILKKPVDIYEILKVAKGYVELV